MFDRIKDSLGTFKDDVEESAEAQESDSEADGVGTDESEDQESHETEDHSESVGLKSKAKSLARGKVVLSDSKLDGPLEDLKLSLLEANVAYDAAEEVTDGIRDRLVGQERRIGSGADSLIEDALYEALVDVLSVNQFDFDQYVEENEKPVSVVFTGVNGVGKTTTIAKLAKRLEDRGYSTVMANGDTYRAGAQEQIEDHAESLDVDLISHEQGGDPAAVLYDAVEYAEANDVDVVLGDTAGRLHTDDGLMEQLRKIDRVVDPDLTVFVDEAVAGQDAVNRANEFGEATDADGAILTMAEADDNGGAAVSVSHEAGLPVLYLGVGQGYGDLETFNPETMAARLVGRDD